MTARSAASHNRSTQTQPQLQFDATDDGLVTFGSPNPATGAVPFQETGYEPVTQITLDSNMLNVPAKFNGLFLQYEASGVQTGGSIDYTSLHYELVAYQGLASFTHAADGTPTVSGITSEVAVAQGDLLPGQGHLAFNAAGGISGQINATFQVGGRTIGTLETSVQHVASDIGPTSGGGLTLSNGTVQATLVPLGHVA